MKSAFTVRGAVVLLNLTVCTAQLGVAGCDSNRMNDGSMDSSAEPPFMCEEPKDCESPFEQLAAGCLEVTDELANGASQWRSKAQTSKDEPFEPSYVFRLREKLTRWDDGDLPPERTEETTYRIVVERGVAIEKRKLFGSKSAPEEFDTVEKLFEFLAEAQCLREEDPVRYRTVLKVDSTLGCVSRMT